MLLFDATINSSLQLTEIISGVSYSVIPACRVAPGDSPRRESFLKNDPGQAGMTKRINMYDPEAEL
jgi:hypothetical protein